LGIPTDGSSSTLYGMTHLNLNESHPVGRFRRFGVSGGNIVLTTPSAGADCDCVMMSQSRNGDGQAEEVYRLSHGEIVRVESGGTFSAGVNLVTDSNGRAVAAGAGTVLGRSLQASTATGQLVLMVVRAR
jgi:hypothetical protein